MRDGVDEPDGRERSANDGADARHEVVPALARRAHGDGHGAQVVGELRLGHVERVVGHRLRLDERLVADGRRRVRACVKIKILRGVHAIDAALARHTGGESPKVAPHGFADVRPPDGQRSSTGETDASL